MLSYWVNYGVRNYTTSVTWRFPIAFQIVLSLVYVIGMLFMPESPRWLCKTDQTAEATHVMAALNGETEDAPQTVNDIRGIVDSVQIESAIGKAFRFRDLLTGGPTQHLRRVVIGISSQFFQQLGVSIEVNDISARVPLTMSSGLQCSHLLRPDPFPGFLRNERSTISSSWRCQYDCIRCVFSRVLLDC